MKKSKTDFDAVELLIKNKTSADSNITNALMDLIKKNNTESSARGLKYTLSYYGLADGTALTLESIGEKLAHGLTRERVRQVIDHSLGNLLKAERLEVQDKRPYERVQGAFSSLLASTGQNFAKLSDFEKTLRLGPIAEDKKGLIAFLNDAGIRQVVYREDHYIYPESVTRNEAITLIQASNKKTRRAKTVEKMQGMAKTVTYVPIITREYLLAKSAKDGIALNRMYEQILESFIALHPCSSSADFVKTQSWKARRGKAEWCQVGIYIEKSIFDLVKEHAKQIKPTTVSNMAFICQAFIWASKR